MIYFAVSIFERNYLQLVHPESYWERSYVQTILIRMFKLSMKFILLFFSRLQLTCAFIFINRQTLCTLCGLFFVYILHKKKCRKIGKNKMILKK